MKTNIARNTIRVTLLAAALLASALWTGPAKAQAGFQGQFTLSQETRWGQAVLAPGDYELKIVSANVGPLVVIRDAKSLRTVAYESLNIREDSSEGASALLIRTRGNEHVVCTLRIAELGESIIYERPTTRRNAEEEARKTQTIPILVAKN
jgi:hypothetical protein